MVDFFFLGALDLIPMEENRLVEFFLVGGEEENMVADAGGAGAVIDVEESPASCMGERPGRPVHDWGSVSKIELLCEKDNTWRLRR